MKLRFLSLIRTSIPYDNRSAFVPGHELSFDRSVRLSHLLLTATLLLVARSAIGAVISLGTFEIAPELKNVYATPVVQTENELFYSYIRKEGSINQTVLVHFDLLPYALKEKGRKTLEDYTIKDTWHSVPSIGFSAGPVIHATYGMHNMPWQYSQFFPSEGRMEFAGESISKEQKQLVERRNKTPFKSVGTAAIPGQQVTYPTFFHLSDNRLALTYRYATKPALAFKDRAYAGALATFHESSGSWRLIGDEHHKLDQNGFFPAIEGTTSPVAPFLFDEKAVPYLLRLFEDRSGRIHLTWTWRMGHAGPDVILPSYAFTDDFVSFFNIDGRKLQLPIDRLSQDTHLVSDGAYSPLTTMGQAPDGTLFLIFQQYQGKFLMMNLTTREVAPSPYGISQLVTTKKSLYGMSTGPVIYKFGILGRFTEYARPSSVTKHCYHRSMAGSPVGEAFIVESLACDASVTELFLIR